MEGFRLQASGFRLRASGFTLVELLLVISIIGILATVSISVTRQVYHTARVAKTDSTIMKIDRVIMDMYAAYENRRVPSHNFGSSDVASKVTQAARLWFLRDMIRMEMPGNWDEVLAPPVQMKFKYGPGNDDITISWLNVGDSPLRRLYKNTYEDALANLTSPGKGYTQQQAKDVLNRYAPAKCLFLIIMYGNPEARELFFDHEIATDDDGLSYFVDGWGNPIYYLRWAPGLSLSERQPNVLLSNQNESYWIKDSSELPSVPDEYKDAVQKVYSRKEDFAKNRPDPLDPTDIGGVMESLVWNEANSEWRCTVDLTSKWQDDTPKTGWALLPVILSSGGVRENTMEETFGIRFLPGNAKAPVVDPFDSPLGSPLKTSDDPYKGNILNHAIIHNHRTRR